MRIVRRSRRWWGALAFVPLALLGATGCPVDDCECVDQDGDGFCTATCSGSLIDCDDGDAFVFPGAADHHIDGYDYDCNGDDLGGVGAPCNADAQCTATCNQTSGRCVAAPEDCRRPGDEDGNGLADCEDPACATECAELTGALCAEPATPGAATQPPPTRLAETSCTGVEPATAYAIVPGSPGESGMLTLWTEGASAFEVRTQACAEPGTCSRGIDGTVSWTRPWEGGAPLWVVVPGAGTHTLYWSYEAAVCGNGTMEQPEECDDGDIDDGDGCSADCSLEYDFNVCSVAEPLNLGLTTVSAAGGTRVVETECSPFEGRTERAFTLPVTTGRIRVAWSAERAVVISPRRVDCAGLPGICEGPATSGVFELDLDERPASFLLIDGWADNMQIIIESLD